jgi:hypothetical protein
VSLKSREVDSALSTRADSSTFNAPSTNAEAMRIAASASGTDSADDSRCCAPNSCRARSIADVVHLDRSHSIDRAVINAASTPRALATSVDRALAPRASDTRFLSVAAQDSWLGVFDCGAST